jgi:hypothetical protein
MTDKEGTADAQPFHLILLAQDLVGPPTVASSARAAGSEREGEDMGCRIRVRYLRRSRGHDASQQIPRGPWSVTAVAYQC